jgi:hypothetical protein
VSRRPGRGVLALLLVAGVGDLATGLSLVAAPALVLAALGLPAPDETIYLRLVGVFVGSVGAAYLYPLLLSGASRAPRIAAALEWTAGVRLAVALFVAVAVAADALAGPWLLIGAYDAALALAQLALLSRRGLADAR